MKNMRKLLFSGEDTEVSDCINITKIIFCLHAYGTRKILGGGEQVGDSKKTKKPGSLYNSLFSPSKGSRLNNISLIFFLP